MIPIYKPFLKNYKKSAMKAIENGWISNHGINIKLASEKLNVILNVKYSILMNNGTAATHCLYIALKYKYPNIKKIYLPNNTFITPYNCGLYEYPSSIFEIMKISPKTLNIDTSKEYIMNLEQNAAMVIVHNLGNIVNVPRLKRMRPDIIFIEDNCEGLFGKYENMYTSSFDGLLASSISFYGNKTLTTGEGGVFITNDIDVYKYIKKVYSHGMTSEKYKHDILGHNYKMTNIQAGFLYDQLKDYNTIIDKKNEIFKYYLKYLNKCIENDEIIITHKEENTIKANWMFNIIIKSINYSKFKEYMLKKQIQIRPFFYSISCHPHLSEIKNENETAFNKKITEHGAMLPSYPELSEEEIKYICVCINEYLKF